MVGLANEVVLLVRVPVPLVFFGLSSCLTTAMLSFWGDWMFLFSSCLFCWSAFSSAMYISRVLREAAFGGYHAHAGEKNWTKFVYLLMEISPRVSSYLEWISRTFLANFHFAKKIYTGILRSWFTRISCLHVEAGQNGLFGWLKRSWIMGQRFPLLTSIIGTEREFKRVREVTVVQHLKRD